MRVEADLHPVKQMLIIKIARQFDAILLEPEKTRVLQHCEVVEVHEQVLQGELGLHDRESLPMSDFRQFRDAQNAFLDDGVLAVLLLIETDLVLQDEEQPLAEVHIDLVVRLALDSVGFRALDEVDVQLLKHASTGPALQLQIEVVDAH